MQSRTRPRRNLWAYLLPVLILAIGFNIPKALEFRVVQVSTFVLYALFHTQFARKSVERLKNINIFHDHDARVLGVGVALNMDVTTTFHKP